MRHACQIDCHRVAGDVLAEIDRNLHGAGLGLRFLHHLPQPHHLPIGVGHLDTDRVLPRNRGDDPDRRHTEGDGEVVSKVGDLGKPQAGFQLDLILRDHRSSLDLDHSHLEAKVGEGLLKYPSPLADLNFLFIKGKLLGRQ